MPDPRPCCILGVCCPPGGKAQRKALKEWLMEKLFQPDMPGKLYAPPTDSDPVIEGWLDELPWDDNK